MKLKFIMPLLAVAVASYSFTFISGEFYSYKSDGGKYKIDFPSKPEESEQEVETELGKVTMYMAIYDASKDKKHDNVVYLTSYVDYPEKNFEDMSDEKLNTFYEGALNGSIKNLKGELISKKDYKLNSYKGAEADVNYGGGMAVVRIKYLLVKNRLYMMETITETAKLNNSDQHHFFDTFELIQ